MQLFIVLHGDFYSGMERERNDDWQMERKAECEGREKYLDSGCILKAK